jgi:hypothetical protein
VLFLAFGKFAGHLPPKHDVASDPQAAMIVPVSDEAGASSPNPMPLVTKS